MLANLVQFSIRFYGLVILLALLVLSYGGYRFSQAGLDIFPEFSPKRVIVQTEAPGYTAEQVEMLVTRTLETGLGGLAGLDSVRSESIQGLSVITATFSEHSDIYRNRQLVGERLAALAGRLPLGITPIAVPLSSSSATILTLGLRSEKQDLLALRSLVDWTLVPRLLAVPGVADVNVFGGDKKQLQIQADPVQLQRFNLSLDELIDTATRAVQHTGSGFIDTGNQRLGLSLTGLPLSPAQFAQLPILRPGSGRPISLGEVASIRHAPEPPISAAQILGKPGVVLMVIGQYGANTLTVTRQVEQALEELQPIFSQQDIQFYPHLFRPADYIERSLTNLSGHLLLGGLFVLLVLYAFLYNLRTALIAAVAIPVSLAGAVLVLLALDVRLNIMVLGGLAIVLGEVVDDAIIDTENIFRRLREMRLLATAQASQAVPARTVAAVIFNASLEVRSSVVYASFIVALVFVPLLALDGVAGRLFAPLGYAYILAILASLLVALTLTPALCFALLGHASLPAGEPPLLRWIKPLYQRLLAAVQRRFWGVMVMCSVVCIGSFGVFFGLHSQFLPELREGHYMVHTTSLPGTSLAESLRIGTLLTQRFLAITGVESVSQWAGRAERGADTYGSHYSEYEVRLQPLPGAAQASVMAQLRQVLAAFPGISSEVNTFLTERIDETLSGYTAPVVVNLYGQDLDALASQAQAVANVMRGLAGAADVQVRSPPSTPQLLIRLDPDRLAFFGLVPGQVAEILQAAYETRVVGKYLAGDQIIDVAVTLPPAWRQQPDALGDLPIRAKDGSLIRLRQVADLRHSNSRYSILHSHAHRRQTITCQVLGRDLDAFMRELKQHVLVTLPAQSGTYAEFTGAAVEQAEARQSLLIHAGLAGCGVLMFIYLAIGSVRLMLLTLCNLPFALVGGVVAVLVTGAALSVGSVVGFITLFGITVRNSIMLLAHYRHLIEIEEKTWNWATAEQGAAERLPSILMTALVTALAMFPIAFDSDNPGREIMGPMAAIIVGGLASSTLLNLLLMPAILLRFGRFGGDGKQHLADA